MPANQREYSANFNISKTFNKDVKKAEEKRINFN